MRILFCGTPEFALPSLVRLARSRHEICAVVTAVDRPRGRGHQISPTPVAELAGRLGLPVLKVEKVRDEGVLAELEKLRPDALVLVAFGQIIPKRLLDLPPRGAINLHPSLLPRHRGASPIHAPLLAGETKTGVTTMYMDEGLDTGDIILQEECPIDPLWNAGDLHDHLAEKGAGLLLRTLHLVAEGSAPRRPQEEHLASYAPKVEKEEIDWNMAAEAIRRRIHGLSPFPGVHTGWRGRRLKVLRARPGASTQAAAPGTVLGVVGDGVEVATGEGSLVLVEVQPSGKSAMSGADFARGFRAAKGDRLGGEVT